MDASYAGPVRGYFLIGFFLGVVGSDGVINPGSPRGVEGEAHT